MTIESTQHPKPKAVTRGRHSRRSFVAGAVALAGVAASGALTFDLPSPKKVMASHPPSLAPETLPTFAFPKGSRHAEAAHLLRRAGFGGSEAEITRLATLSRENAAGQLLDESAPDDIDERLAALGIDVWNNGYDIERWWLLRMAYTRRPLIERMALFWHNHFATAMDKVKSPWLMLGQNQIFREKGLGSFLDLTLAVAKDPAMLIYLDNRSNVAGHPNENYARELMELHTLGIGNYTEQDVKEAARALTGWSLARRNEEEFRRKRKEINDRLNDPDLSEDEKKELRLEERTLERDYPWEYIFRSRQHDDGLKTFRGTTGPWDGGDVIKMLVSSEVCAEHICGKLFSYFAYENPDKETIERLKAIYFNEGYQIRPIVRAILTSGEFYSDRSYRAQVKSPAVFVAGVVRSLEAETDGRLLVKTARDLGQRLFSPPNPAGWPGGTAWINANSIIARSNFANAIAGARPSSPDRSPAANSLDPMRLIPAPATEAGDVVDVAINLLLDGNISPEDRNILIEYMHTGESGAYRPFALNDAGAESKVRGLIYLLTSSPLYQLA